MFSGCWSVPEKYEKEYVNMFDTYTKIIIFTDSESDFERYCSLFESSMLKYNNMFDIYKNYDINNLKTINDNAGIKPVKVDREIIDFLNFSKKAYDVTEHKINFAFGSVLKIWHSYREEALESQKKASLPSEEELKEAAEHTDINSIEIDEKNNTVFIKDKRTSIDVGALAKGYAVQKTADLLKENGVKTALLNVGGNVCAIGKPLNKDKWNIGIQDPDNPESSKPYEIISVTDKSVVTSGNYQRFYVVNGKKYHHIIDTETLMPADLYKNITIICDDSTTADMLSTALFILPYEKGKALAEKYNAEVFWVFNDNRTERTYAN